MTVTAIVTMYADASAEVVAHEYEAIEQEFDKDVVECTATLFTLSEERPTRNRMDRECEPLGGDLYLIRCGEICFFVGVAFDPSYRMTHAEIVRITRCAQVNPSNTDKKIAKARNGLFQQAVLP
ncbi:MAG: hypothetical protein Q7T86_16110 [Hyphomicrobiaceae bacterium]|jgi:hypothetical protein|nr:hypothetical protein [Hyphomicrobiaceae bacterium]